MVLESVVMREVEHPKFMNTHLAEAWAAAPDNLADTARVKFIPADLSKFGYGLIIIADESVQPTGTIKDRMAAALVKFYKQFALDLLKDNYSEIEKTPVPIFSDITSGNRGLSLSFYTEAHSLPPFKLLIHHDMPSKRLVALTKLTNEIYLTDLTKAPLNSEEIKRLTNNLDGRDLTSIRTPHYSFFVKECVALKPTEIYVPYGSGELFESFLIMQPSGISVLGGEPKYDRSVADKLVKQYNPFKRYDAGMIDALKKSQATGVNTCVEKVVESAIARATEIMNRYCPAEPSAAAGLALYIERFESGKINHNQKIMVVNTGRGI